MALGGDLPGRCRDEEAGSEAETRKLARHRTRDERLRQRESSRYLRANAREGVPARRGDDQAVRWNVDRNARDVGRAYLAAALGTEPKNERSLTSFRIEFRLCVPFLIQLVNLD
jgi:hypothetical protein